jgi:cell pole-organizing protein PopZ
MESSTSTPKSPDRTRVLVVAHKTAATKPLIDAVRQRAQSGPCTFTLLVPNPAHGLHKVVDAEDQGADDAAGVLEQALPALSEAAGTRIAGVIGDPDPVAAVQDAINLQGYDEIIISTLSPRLSRWLRLDLPSKVSGMGLPVTTVTPADEDAEVAAAAGS